MPTNFHTLKSFEANTDCVGVLILHVLHLNGITNKIFIVNDYLAHVKRKALECIIRRISCKTAPIKCSFSSESHSPIIGALKSQTNSFEAWKAILTE